MGAKYPSLLKLGLGAKSGDAPEEKNEHVEESLSGIFGAVLLG